MRMSDLELNSEQKGVREGIDFILDPMHSPIKDDLFEHIDGIRTPSLQANLSAKRNIVRYALIHSGQFTARQHSYRFTAMVIYSYSYQILTLPSGLYRVNFTVTATSLVSGSPNKEPCGLFTPLSADSPVSTLSPQPTSIVTVNTAESITHKIFFFICLPFCQRNSL